METSEKLFHDCHSDPPKAEKNLFIQFEKKNEILRIPTKNVEIPRMTFLGDFSEDSNDKSDKLIIANRGLQLAD